MAQVLSVSPAKSYLDQFETMKQDRIEYDRKWQLCSDYILPRRDFTCTLRPNQLRPHRVTSSTATNANTRMAAMVAALAVDVTGPFVFPNTKRGLAIAGRRSQLDSAALDYLGNLEWDVFDAMLRAKAMLMLRLGSMAKEFCSFGCGVMWTGRKRGFGPTYQTRPVMACWWSENEEGEIDTLYYRMMLPLWRVLQKWPAARTGWPNAKADDRSDQLLTPILICTRPRKGGRKGAVVEAKPFEHVTIAEEKALILEESGFDSFPWHVFRYDPMPGSAYAEGPGCQVLPDVMVLNHLQQAIENGSSQKAMPPLAMPARMFGKFLDRRPGAVNIYNPVGVGIQRADQAIMKLDFTGDITQAVELKKSLIDDIEIGYFVDWLRMRESGDMTAEEVAERRNLRESGMSSILANFEYPMSSLGDRTMEIMVAEGMVAPPPASLSKIEVDWEYQGPLSLAQMRRNVQAAMQLLNARGLIAKDPADPIAAEAVDLEETLRVIAEGLPIPTRMMRSRDEVQSRRDAWMQKQQQAENTQKLSMLAQAARDGGQGVASLAGAAGQGGPAGGAGGAPFAPAAPFQMAA